MVLILQCLGGLALVLLAAGIAIRLAYPLPKLEPRTASAHISDTGDMRWCRFSGQDAKLIPT